MNKEDILKEFEILKTDEDYIRSLCDRINELENRTSLEVYDRLIEFTIDNKLQKSYPWALHHKAWFYFEMGNLNSATRLQIKARTCFERNEDDEGILSAISALIVYNCLNQRFDKAVEYGIEGIELAEAANNYDRLCSIKNNVAVTYIELKEYGKAKELLEQITKMPNISRKENEIANYINLSECERNLGNVDKALDYLNIAYDMALSYRTTILPEILWQLGCTYENKGLYDLAEEKFKKSVQMAQEKKSNLYLYDALMYWAEMDIKLGRFETAINKLKQVEDTITSANVKKNAGKVYYNLSKAYKSLGNYERAYYYLEKHNEFKSSIEKANSLENIDYLDEKRQLEEKKVYKLLYSQTKALYEVGQRITSNLNKEDIFNIVADEMKNLIKCDYLHIGIVRDKVLEYPLCIEGNIRLEMEPTVMDENSLGEYVIKHKQELLINDLSTEYGKYLRNLEQYVNRSIREQNSLQTPFCQSMIFVPIVVNSRVIGVMSVQCYKINSFSMQDVTTLKILSTYMGIAFENARLYKEIEYNANYDSLTKILSRREVLKRSEYMFQNLCNSAKIKYLLMIDIDNFKKINDTYGHIFGDMVLSRVAAAIKSSIDENDIVGRYGGEEFIVIISAEENTFLARAEKIRTSIENLKLHTLDGERVKVTACLGIVPMSSEEKNLQQIISYADMALYKAKTNGKNKVVLYEE